MVEPRRIVTLNTRSMDVQSRGDFLLRLTLLFRQFLSTHPHPQTSNTHKGIKLKKICFWICQVELVACRNVKIKLTRGNPLICSSNNITCSKLFKKFDWWFHYIFGLDATSPDLHQLCVAGEVFPSSTTEVQFENSQLVLFLHKKELSLLLLDSSLCWCHTI